MRVTMTCMAIGAMLAAAAAPAAAQTPRHELTVFAGIALGEPSSTDPDDVRILRHRGPFGPFTTTRSSLDGSAEFGVRVGRDLGETLVLEGDFSIAPNHTARERIHYSCEFPPICLVPADALVEEAVVAYHYGAGVGLRLPGGSTWQPMVVAGLGGVTFDGDQIAGTRFAFRAGGALRVVLERLSVRLELVDVVVADHVVTGRAEHDLHLRLGFGLRW